MSSQLSETEAINNYSVCKLCDIADWKDEEFLLLSSDIMARAPKNSPIHRKLWEFTKTVQALKRTGQLHSEAVGLSVAAGSERILYYLTHFVRCIVASDIYGEGDFADLEADGGFLNNPEKFAPYAYNKDRLEPVYLDALNLRFPDNSFDFAFSLSSIEHFGGVQKSALALKEMGRVIKPGGVVVVTTDVTLNGLITNEVFTRKNIAWMIAESGLELEHDIDWSISDESKVHSIDMRKDDLATLPHVNLKIFGARFTSIVLTLRKPKTSFSKSLEYEEFLKNLEEIRNAPVPFKFEETSKLLSWICTKFRGLKYRIEEFLWGQSAL